MSEFQGPPGPGGPAQPAAAPPLTVTDTEAARLAVDGGSRSTTRANIMVVGAAVGLIACLVTGIFLELYIKTDTQASGLIIGLVVSVAGTFGNALLQAYSFEFGNSRSGAIQSDQISSMNSQLMAHTANSVPISALSQLNNNGGGG